MELVEVVCTYGFLAEAELHVLESVTQNHELSPIALGSITHSSAQDKASSYVKLVSDM
jgi:hypothetical protein